MSDIIRDPFWKIVGVVISIIPIIIAFTQIKRKRLSYWIVLATPIAWLHEDFKEFLTLIYELYDNAPQLYEDTNINNLYLIILRVSNTGNGPITKSDYERPISISCEEGSKIIHESLIEKKPENLEITYQKFHNRRVVFDPILLNKKDEFSIKLIVSNYNDDIKMDCRISGIKKMQLGSRNSNSFFQTNLYNYLIIGLNTLVILLVYFLETQTWIIVALVTFLLVLLFAILDMFRKGL
jgi:hypothetical protein